MTRTQIALSNPYAPGGPLLGALSIVRPVKTLVLACPKRDMIRLWLWLVQQPWFEDWWEHFQDIPLGIENIRLAYSYI